MPTESRFDPILFLLFAGILLMTATMVGVTKWIPDDGQLFQVLSGLATGFAGAFFGRINPKAGDTGATGPGMAKVDGKFIAVPPTPAPPEPEKNT